MDYILPILFGIWLLFGLISFAMLLRVDKETGYVRKEGDTIIELVTSLFSGPTFMIVILVVKYKEKRGGKDNVKEDKNEKDR